ncbi:MAG: S-layer homology domain-containing protein, partial [Candidatus Riflebacteria bacterium]|nr:S-layer homology domain-containing protein [Candidatus Riflebacteria bacterium]
MIENKILNTALILLASESLATAAPFSDVPADHWACQAVSEMADKGIVQGFPNETFKGNENVSRYQLAMITSRILASVEQNGISSISKNDLQTLEKLSVE